MRRQSGNYVPHTAFYAQHTVKSLPDSQAIVVAGVSTSQPGDPAVDEDASHSCLIETNLFVEKSTFTVVKSVKYLRSIGNIRSKAQPGLMILEFVRLPSGLSDPLVFRVRVLVVFRILTGPYLWIRR
jgi:hypothetical protein